MFRRPSCCVFDHDVESTNREIGTWEPGFEGSKGGIAAAAGADLATVVTKFVAAAFTSSSPMFAKDVHSVIDTANQGLLLIGLAHSRKPADGKHPFGDGAEVYFWSFLVAVFLFALRARFSTYEGVIGIISDEEAELTSPLIALGGRMITPPSRARLAAALPASRPSPATARSRIPTVTGRPLAIVLTIAPPDPPPVRPQAGPSVTSRSSASPRRRP